MLAALLIAFLLGGGGSGGGILTPGAIKQIGKQVEVAVSDVDRAEAAKQTLAELKVEVKQFEKRYGKSAKALTGLYKDHGAEADRMIEVLDGLNSGWEASQERAIELRFALKESLTESEWATVFGDG